MLSLFWQFKEVKEFSSNAKTIHISLFEFRSLDLLSLITQEKPKVKDGKRDDKFIFSAKSVKKAQSKVQVLSVLSRYNFKILYI